MLDNLLFFTLGFLYAKFYPKIKSKFSFYRKFRRFKKNMRGLDVL